DLPTGVLIARPEVGFDGELVTWTCSGLHSGFPAVSLQARNLEFELLEPRSRALWNPRNGERYRNGCGVRWRPGHAPRWKLFAARREVDGGSNGVWPGF